MSHVKSHKRKGRVVKAHKRSSKAVGGSKHKKGITGLLKIKNSLGERMLSSAKSKTSRVNFETAGYHAYRNSTAKKLPRKQKKVFLARSTKWDKIRRGI